MLSVVNALFNLNPAIVKMFNVRRNLDPSQKRQVSESSRILAEVMAKHLNIPSFSMFYPSNTHDQTDLMVRRYTF